MNILLLHPHRPNSPPASNSASKPFCRCPSSRKDPATCMWHRCLCTTDPRCRRLTRSRRTVLCDTFVLSCRLSGPAVIGRWLRASALCRKRCRDCFKAVRTCQERETSDGLNLLRNRFGYIWNVVNIMNICICIINTKQIHLVWIVLGYIRDVVVLSWECYVRDCNHSQAHYDLTICMFLLYLLLLLKIKLNIVWELILISNIVFQNVRYLDTK